MTSDYKAMKKCDLTLKISFKLMKMLIRQKKFLVQIVLLCRNGATFINSYNIYKAKTAILDVYIL